MMYLLAIFCSPLALLFTGKPFQALFNLILYVLSIVCWVTIILHSVGLALWAVGLDPRHPGHQRRPGGPPRPDDRGRDGAAVGRRTASPLPLTGEENQGA